MGNRRSFILKSLTSLSAISVLPDLNVFASSLTTDKPPASPKGEFKLRFALASDGHYAQENVDSKKQYSDIVQWLNAEHEKAPLDFVIMNGDIVHDKPNLLKEVKETYFEKFKFPFYALPGNHDLADTALWKSVFGYEDNYSFTKNEVGFILANTSNTKGEYICPDNEFLKTALEKFKNNKTVFVVLHIPPYKWLPEDTFYADCTSTIELLHKYPNVKAVFHGHDHGLDGVRYTAKLPHFFDGHFGGSWGTAYKGYRVVEINGTDEIQTYQVNASQNPILNSFKIK